ncbi:MAG: hypothetical protein QXD43_00560 [Candidatus Aenigmatarchaeota archaeon]
MFNKFGILGRIHGKITNLGYKLGLVEFKREDVNLSKIPEIKLPQAYKDWYPGKEKEIKESKILPDYQKAKVLQYFRRGNIC